ncbi:hypothetical protein SOVF_185080, partial [Spinacia oleracea]
MATMPCGTFVPYCGLQSLTPGMYSTTSSNWLSSQ